MQNLYALQLIINILQQLCKTPIFRCAIGWCVTYTFWPVIPEISADAVFVTI